MATRLRRPIVACAVCLALGCGSDDDSGVASNVGTGGNGASAGTGATASGGGGGSSAGTGGSGGSGGSVSLGGAPSKNEVCDRLDNDGDGTVDEDCVCSSGEKQQCYVAGAGPSEGCKWGEQTCAGTHWGDSPCTGASYPAQGESACCTKLGATPKHELYEAFLAAYPPANMPKTIPAIQAFSPTANGQGMKWANVVVGNELVDAANGGVIVQNIEAGRKVSHDAAVASMPAGATVVATKEDPVIIEVLGGGGANCTGVGWGWGSVLFQDQSGAVSELVYLYIGFCWNGDVELYQYSEQPLQVCKAPVVPR